MKRSIFSRLAVTAIMIFAAASITMAHCQVPCGIYDDMARIDMLNEHITTIEKSMNEIIDLSAAETPNYNQIVRWVNNKDDHADKFSEVVTYYFMTQRIKPVEPTDAGYGEYQKKVEVLHRMLVNAMKCKQTTDKLYVAKLRDLVTKFKKMYFSEEDLKAHEH